MKQIFMKGDIQVKVPDIDVDFDIASLPARLQLWVPNFVKFGAPHTVEICTDKKGSACKTKIHYESDVFKMDVDLARKTVVVVGKQRHRYRLNPDALRCARLAVSAVEKHAS